MIASRLTRSALAALVAMGSFAPLSSWARPSPRRAAPAAAGLVVDVTHLRAIGLGPTADLIQQAAYREFAAIGMPGGNRLVVRFEALSLQTYAGSEGGDGGGGGGGGGGSGGSGNATNNDYLEGDATVIGPGGQVVRTIHHVLALPANAAGAYYLPGAEQRRVVGLARTFAEWIKRDLG